MKAALARTEPAASSCTRVKAVPTSTDLEARLELGQEAAFHVVRRLAGTSKPTNVEIAAAWAVECARVAPGAFPGRSWHVEAALAGRVTRGAAVDIAGMAEVFYDAMAAAAR